MKKIIIGVAVVIVVGIMFFFYQQPFGGGSTLHHANSKSTHPSNNPQKSKSNLTAAYQNAVAHAKTAQPLSMAEVKRDGIVPKTLIIPSLKVEANVDQVGLLKNGQIGVPNGTQNVAWYKEGAKPGQKGNAIIDGHVDSYKGPAVFFNLKKLNKNDKIYIVGKNGKKKTDL